MIWSWTVEDGVSGERADRLLHRALEAGLGTWPENLSEPEASAFSASSDENEFTPPSRSQVQRWIDDGRVTVHGKPIKSATKLSAGLPVQIEVPEPRSMTLIPEDRPLDILYEDAHLIVVNKPPALTVHPSVTQPEGTLVHALLFHIKDLSGIGGVLRPGIVHRIDKDTSGALVISKTDACHAGLAQIFATHEIERRYWALCYGAPAWNHKDLETTIARSPTDRKKMAVEVKNGKRAVTQFKVIERYNGMASWLEATLETGRTHQVRVHLTHLSHSLLGDPIYGTPSERQPKWIQLPLPVKTAIRKLPGQALHARVLGFTHPITGQKLRFEAAPPPAFSETLAALRASVENPSP